VVVEFYFSAHCINSRLTITASILDEPRQDTPAEGELIVNRDTSPIFIKTFSGSCLGLFERRKYVECSY